MNDKRVIIVDDHPLILMAVKIIIENHGFNVVATATNGMDAIKLVRELEPDIMIIDIEIPKLDGIAVINRIHTYSFNTKVLVLSSHDTEYAINSCIRAGAAGFVSKQKDLEEVISAIKAILSGYIYFPSLDVFKKKIDSFYKVNPMKINLSAREIMVLKELVKGKPNKQIASEMMLSDKTISTYKVRLFKKLGVTNLIELTKVAQDNNIV
ncbi:response regulator transcription factor [Vibrio metschnikovii]|uniref:Response regulator transcription factor n=2 Tax=Unclassified Bacteria TaxID=49928 RepID=A0AAU6T291_UNCXX|nr:MULTISPECIES: response regulator transcription factor [Vibrio]EKO3556553.1 response regulator transcription factor [Vibrio metschnikovii]EKO3567364.1 response regulator transcription factor [Vibrio metschnikovii]EKO3570670.1 response regulator transcription factor [Vibrio metschnikovii]EKO3575627.1 response regulator transcription factor [Vibrio metschnikovii]EKO3580618.1 response regulator transcription factor [Vibrio metschnikovii]